VGGLPPSFNTVGDQFDGADSRPPTKAFKKLPAPLVMPLRPKVPLKGLPSPELFDYIHKDAVSYESIDVWVANWIAVIQLQHNLDRLHVLYQEGSIEDIDLIRAL
jgi:hypothetical protein